MTLFYARNVRMTYIPDSSDEVEFVAMMTKFANRYFRPTLRRSIWESLSKDDQQVWDKLSSAAKQSIISGLRNPPSPDSNNTKSARSANIMEQDSQDRGVGDKPDDTDNEQAQDDIDMLINSATRGNGKKMDVRKFLAGIPTKKAKDEKSKLSANINETFYNVSRASAVPDHALVDRGANGGIAGENVRVFAITDRKVSVSGIDNHRMDNLNIVSAGGVVKTQRGDAIAIMHQYAHNPMGKTIHSSVQLEDFKNAVDERSTKVKGATQSITTVDGYVIPLRFNNGLPYMQMRPYTDREWEELPHVVLTSDVEWDPSRMDEDRDEDDWLNQQPDDPTDYPTRPFNLVGEYIAESLEHTSGIHIPVGTDWAINNAHLIQDELLPIYQVEAREVKPVKRDFNALSPYFLYQDPYVIQRTFDNTTQFARTGIISGRISQTHRAPFPALNVRRRNEPVATDTVFGNVPAVDDGATCEQFFAGFFTKFCWVHGMKTDKEFVQVLMDEIRARGAMDQLISDHADSENSTKVVDLLRHMCVDGWQAEPYYKHQNPAERRYREVKHRTNVILNRTGADESAWLLCLAYVCFILNRMVLRSLKWKTPYEKLFGQTPDISMIFRFKFWDLVYYQTKDSLEGRNFPSHSNERPARFVGFSESVGHKMTYILLTTDTRKIIYRSRIRHESTGANLRLADQYISPIPDASDESDSSSTTSSSSGDKIPSHDSDSDEFTYGDPEDSSEASGDDDSIASEDIIEERVQSREWPMASIDPEDLVGRSYLSKPNKYGERTRMHIVEQLEELDKALNTAAPEFSFELRIVKIRSMRSSPTMKS